MSGRKIDNSIVGATDWTAEVESKNIMKIGFNNMAFTEDTTTNLPALIAGSAIEINGTVYVFDSGEVIGGTILDGGFYIKVTGGISATIEFVNGTVPKYDYLKKGFYLGADERVIFSGTKTGTVYTNKNYIDREFRWKQLRLLNTGSEALSATAVGDYGIKSESFNNFGVYGQAANWYGVYGKSTNQFGVYGDADNGYGVYGKSAIDIGVFGKADNDRGVNGHALNNFGVYGLADNFYGVYGDAPNFGVYGDADVNYGVYGKAINEYGVYGEALKYGVKGESTSDYGVYGQAAVDLGVYGIAQNYYGVYGKAIVAFGVYGDSDVNYGVYGKALNQYGVYGQAPNYAVYGLATANFGVYGESVDFATVGAATNQYGVYGQADSRPVGGNGAYYNDSNENLKINKRSVRVLDALRENPLQQFRWSWEHTNGSTDEFIAPMAQDIQQTFDLDEDEDGYATLDGIALFGVQELLREVDKLKLQNEKLLIRVDELEER